MKWEFYEFTNQSRIPLIICLVAILRVFPRDNIFQACTKIVFE